MTQGETNLKTGLQFHLKQISVTRVDNRATAVPPWDIVKLWNDLKQLSRRGWRCFDQRHRRDQKYLLCPSQTWARVSKCSIPNRKHMEAETFIICALTYNCNHLFSSEIKRILWTGWLRSEKEEWGGRRKLSWVWRWRNKPVLISRREFLFCIYRVFPADSQGGSVLELHRRAWFNCQ